MLGLRKSAQDSIQQGDVYFRWRGGDVSRLESLFDAVIALALTLIVVSIEVPSSFDALFSSFGRLPAFAICFAILMMVWYYHFLFHRRYGLENFPVLLMNAALMFLVVFYVYPLKFLYLLLFADAGDIAIRNDQIPTLMRLYHGGFVAIFVVLLMMYGYAYLKKEQLKLSQNETTLTKFKISEHMCYILVGMIALILTFFHGMSPISGLVYASVAPVQFVNGYLWGRRIRTSE